MKNLLKATSVVMMLLAILTVVLGVITLANQNNVAIFDSVTMPDGVSVQLAVQVLGYAFAIVGIAELLVALFGWCGATRGAKKLLMTAIILVTVVLVSALYNLFTTSFDWHNITSIVVEILFVVSAVGTYREIA